MRPSLERLLRYPNYIKSFGLLDGLRLASGIERFLPQKSEVTRSFRVPGYSQPFILRDCVADHAAFWQCIVRQQYDLTQFPHTAYLRTRYENLLAAGRTPVILDLGANIGLSAMVFAEAFPRAHVLAVEPEAQNFALLTRNAAPYGSRIRPLQGAVWPHEEKLAILNPQSGAMSFRIGTTTSDTGIVAYTVHSLMRIAGDTEALIVKMDIEGAQKSLFAENTGWIEHVDAILLELDDWLFPWQGTSVPFFRAMSKHSFEYLMNGENLVCFNARLAHLPLGQTS